MRDELIHRQLGKVLWDIGGVEAGAAVACGLMVSTPFLTTAERRFVRDRMWPEERGHDRIHGRGAAPGQLGPSRRADGDGAGG